MTAVVSKTQLASWATKVCGVSIGKSLPIEKQCSNGAIYCQLLEAARPGSINLAKVNKEADADHKALPNYKLLEAALEKAGVEHPLDLPNLSKANPIAHFDLLQKIYALAPPATPGSAKGLRALDANSLDEGRGAGSRGGGKQGSKRQLLKRPAEEIAPPAEEASAADELAERAAAATAAADALRAELAQMRVDLETSRSESHSLREEADFYIQKLERIEETCVTHPPASVATEILKLLHEGEADVSRQDVECAENR